MSNLNTNIKLDITPEAMRAMLPQLAKALPYILGLALVGVFAYTAYELNQAVNVQPASSQSVIVPLPKVVFYQDVINSLSDRNVVNGDVPLNLGNGNPF